MTSTPPEGGSPAIATGRRPTGLTAAAGTAAGQAHPARAVAPPAPAGAIPTARQLAHHRRGFYGFIHFTTNTFTGREWGFGDESPAVFAPDALDAHQWARTARAAGMAGLILTCKHHDGFCLWPSAHTAHSVRASPWRGGHGDVVRDLSDACRAEGLAFGIYLSPWDRNHPDYGRPAYVDYFRAQLRELLTAYGPVFEVWFDGANGGDGWYGGANERRAIDAATYYGWPETHALVRELAPDAVLFSDAGPDVRWVGNERGIAAETSWCAFNLAGRHPGGPDPHDLAEGHRHGSHWVPPEVDVSIRPGWFWHEHEHPRTVAGLLDLWFTSVGRGAALLLNLPPDRHGLIPERDRDHLLRFRRALDQLFAHDLARGAAATASNVRGGDPAFAAANAIDGRDDTYWASDDGDTAATLELTFAHDTAINLFVLQEHLALGQRVTGWAIDAHTPHGWRQLATGTTIGWKRIVRTVTVTTAHLRVRLSGDTCLTLATFAVHHAPPLLGDPRITRDRAGLVAIDAGPGIRARFTTDGTTPTAAAPLANGPVPLPHGGTVAAVALAADNPGALDVGSGSGQAITRRFGLAKHLWRIHSCSSQELPTAAGGTDLRADHLLDDDPTTFWHSAWTPSATQSRAEHPHAVTIDLGARSPAPITALGYLPRQDHIDGGIVERCRFDLSADGSEWTPATDADLRFDNIGANPIEQIVPVAHPRVARYVRFTALAAVNRHPGASAAAINVYL
jgi:alpha-L-fucosidase